MSKRIVSSLVCLVMVLGLFLTVGYAETAETFDFHPVFAYYQDDSQEELVVEGYFYNVSNTPVSGVTGLSFDVYDVNRELVAHAEVVDEPTDEVKLADMKLNPGECKYWSFIIQSPNKGLDLTESTVEHEFKYDSFDKVKLEDGIKTYYNNKKINFSKTKPKVENGRTLVPIRAITEAMGAKVDWDGKTSTATITRDDVSIKLKIGDKEAYVNGEKVQLDVPAKIENGSTLVPLRFIGETFGAQIFWGQDAKIIIIAE